MPTPVRRTKAPHGSVRASDRMPRPVDASTDLDLEDEFCMEEGELGDAPLHVACAAVGAAVGVAGLGTLAVDVDADLACDGLELDEAYDRSRPAGARTRPRACEARLIIDACGAGSDAATRLARTLPGASGMHAVPRLQASPCSTKSVSTPVCARSFHAGILDQAHE